MQSFGQKSLFRHISSCKSQIKIMQLFGHKSPFHQNLNFILLHMDVYGWLWFVAMHKILARYKLRCLKKGSSRKRFAQFAQILLLKK